MKATILSVHGFGRTLQIHFVHEENSIIEKFQKCTKFEIYSDILLTFRIWGGTYYNHLKSIHIMYDLINKKLPHDVSNYCHLVEH